jgi:putative ATP-binding cassette transporter
MNEPPVAINRTTWRQFTQAIRELTRSEVGAKASALLFLLVAFLLLINGLNVINSYVGRDFMTAIEQRDRAGFGRYALLYLVVFAASTLVSVVHRFAEERLGLLWREWLTRSLVGSYLAGRAYYRMDVEGELANPDQRIADDVRSFATSTLSFLLMFANGAITAVAFSGVLWEISPRLFAVAVSYAVLGSLFTLVLCCTCARTRSRWRSSSASRAWPRGSCSASTRSSTTRSA